MDLCPDAVTQLEVTGDEVGVHVGQKHMPYGAVQPLGVEEILLDIALWVDHRRPTADLIGNQVRRVRETTKVVLFEDHRDPFGCGTIRMYGRGDSQLRSKPATRRCIRIHQDQLDVLIRPDVLQTTLRHRLIIRQRPGRAGSPDTSAGSIP